MTNALLPTQQTQPNPPPARAQSFVQIQVGPESGSVVGLDTLPSYRGKPSFSMLQTVYPAVRGSGSEVDRASRTDVLPLFFDSAHGGFKPDSAVLPYGQYKIYYRDNDGVYGTWIPGKGTKAYKPVVQADLISADFSAYRSGNKRVHSAMWPTSSGLRNVFGLGPYIVLDTSVSNPALKQPATADNVTDNILSCAVGPIDSSNTLAFVIGTDGQTDDAKYTTDPTADSITWTSLITYSNANDRIWWIFYAQTLKRWILAGIINNVAGIYAFDPATASYPLTSSTLQPVVWTATKDTKGDIASVTTTARYVTVGSQDIAATGTKWSNPGRITASDDSYATEATTGDTVPLLGSGCDFSDVPLAALILGILIEIEEKNGTGAGTVTLTEVKPIVNATATGVNHADGSAVSNTEGFVSYGGSSDTWGLNSLTGADVQNMGVTATYTVGSTASISVDSDRLTLTYQYPGYQASVPAGSWGLGELPSDPGTFVAVEPQTGDATAINIPRRLVKYAFVLDGANNRVTVAAPEYPDTQAAYVGDAEFTLGGVACATGDTSALFNHVKLVRSDGNTVDLSYHGRDAAKSWEVYKLTNKGTVLLEDADTTGSDDAQLQCYTSPSSSISGHYTVGLKQSLSGTTIASKPIQWAEHAGRLNLQQNIHYRFIPDSTTGLTVEREFVPSDMGADPLLFNTSQTKTDSAVSLTFCELDYGAGESVRGLTAAMHQGRQVDDGTSYGTVRLRIDTGGDILVASAEVDVTFGTGVGQTKPRDYYDIGSDAAPSVELVTNITKLTLGSSSSSTNTPNMFPVLEEAVGKFPQGRLIVVQLEHPEERAFLVKQHWDLELALGTPVLRLHMTSLENSQPDPYWVLWYDSYEQNGGAFIVYRQSQSGNRARTTA